MIPTRDPALRVTPAVLMREPLFWATSAAFIGATVGLIGTSRQAAAFDSPTEEMADMVSAAAMQASGEMLVAVSLIGVPSLLGRSRGVVRPAVLAGGFLILLLAAASSASIFFLAEEQVFQPNLSLPMVSLYAYWGLPPLIPLPFVLVALTRRRWRLGALLSGLCALAVPIVLVWVLFPEISPSSPLSGAHWVLGIFGWGVSLPEAVLWALLGAMYFREARERSLWRASRLEERENRKRARRLYEEGLGQGNLSVVKELVSENFRDLRHGAKGKPGMERVFTDLWKSFPDLAVSVEEQETEGDLVKTRLSLTGTDRGGILWYPATGRRATFTVRFVDRFSGGVLIEHGGETDTEGLLRQLGLETRP